MVQTRFLLGPAGSGKTFRCLAEIREALTAEPDGPTLLLIAPKQTTYQLERQLLAEPSLAGYSRLHILSFERLALFLFEQLQKTPPRLLDEEGRLMVLRGLLAKKREELKLFRASARLTGFAQHLSAALRELQRQQLTPESLRELAAKAVAVESLSLKLQDFATLLGDYRDWLQARGLHDADQLADFATQMLHAPHAPLAFGGLWVDGFAEFSPQELDLLAEVAPLSTNVTITLCLDRAPAEKISWLSNWSAVRLAYHQCRDRLAHLQACEMTTELLPRRISQSRFANNPVLQQVETHWAEPKRCDEASARPGAVSAALRVAICADPEAEVKLAAREILRFVRAGGRYREITVLARNLETYHAPLVNIFTRYEIPFFLDRREPVSHHPLAELTRNALRTVAFAWTHDDWFAALKTGLVPAADADIDRLENEALARGWKGPMWLRPLNVAEQPELTEWLEKLRLKIIPPFKNLAMLMERQNKRPNGVQLAEALREFWEALNAGETLEAWSREETDPRPIHLTVWEQMHGWADNVELAFPSEALELREWLPILEAGLAGMTVGVIPPALDQVLIGAIDRSRNPDIRLGVVVGMNEGVFPAPPESSVLLTDADRAELEKQGVSLSNARRQISQERFYGYVALTRARQRLVLTACNSDATGKTLNPSPFLSDLKKIVPSLEFEKYPWALDWRRSEHASELIVPLLRKQIRSRGAGAGPLLDELPALAPLRERLGHLLTPPAVESLNPELAARLYGPALRTSVSRMEQFAACPFKFFVHSGLRAEERKKFELDARDQGNFQHEVLATFHEQLRKEKKRWRDIQPAEARERIGKIAASLAVSFRDGLLQVSEESRFTARVLTESLQDFAETLVGWMRAQYAFDPVAVELPFGDEGGTFPPWELDLGDGHRLLLHGRIDRVDIRREDGDEALCVVVDYKSSLKQLDPILMEHNLQLQLAAYLNVLRRWPNPQPLFGVARLLPAGVFYVNLRGKYERGENRDDALADVDSARRLAYRHSGRFDAGALRKLDERTDAMEGDQFNYRLTQEGKIHGGSREALETAAFIAMLDAVEAGLKQMGRQVYAGAAKIDPYRKGLMTACGQCDYHAICRIDPWRHKYRMLRKTEPSAAE